MLPLKMDRVYSAVVVSGGLFNVALTLALVPSLDAMGTAIAATTTETLVAVTLCLYLIRRGLNVVSRRTPGTAEAIPPDPGS
jgi:O-antigen/teichoic acid export membrane protein